MPEKKELRWECTDCGEEDEPCVLSINCDPDEISEKPSLCPFEQGASSWEVKDV